MVDFSSHTLPWTIFLISSCVLLIILVVLGFILCTGCHTKKRQLNLDNNPKRNTDSCVYNMANNYRRIFNSTFHVRCPSSADSKLREDYGSDYHQFTSDNLSLYKGYHYSCEKEALVEIKDIGKTDGKSRSEHGNLPSDGYLDVCDTRSYISRISRNSFYSTYPHDDQQAGQDLLDTER